MTTPGPTAGDEWFASICAGSAMGALVAETDWASTPLGPPETWSRALRAAVGVCLTSRFPMLVVWGPELTKIYNDGYRPILGSQKHPQALGAPAKEIWGEIWEEIGPDFEQVLRTGVPTWHEHDELVMERNGYPEECFFIWSYGPLFDDDGEIAGVLDIVTETTSEVVARRRLRCATELSEELFEAEQVTDVCLRAVAALDGCPDDVAEVDIHLRVGTQLPRVAGSRRTTSSLVTHDVIEEVSRTGVARVVGGERGTNRPAAAYVMPVVGGRGGITGVVVASLNPRRPFDDDYETFLGHLANIIGAALDNAYRRAVEVDTYRSISDTLQSAMLTPVADFPTVAARYLPAMGQLSVGGDWYDVIDLDGDRRGLVVGDCVGHGLDAATAMGQLRSAARAMLLEGRSPAEALESLDRFAESTAHAFGATVVCAVIDRAARTFTYARAGHPPPLLLGPGSAEWLEGSGGPPLATVEGVTRSDHTVPLRAGDLVVLYTDGLVERRDEHIDEGLRRLEQAARDAYEAPVHVVANRVLSDVLSDAPGDDVVLVVKRLEV